MSAKLGEVSQNVKKHVPMEKTMYFWRPRPMQMDNRGADKLLIKWEVKMATPNRVVIVKQDLNILLHLYC